MIDQKIRDNILCNLKNLINQSYVCDNTLIAVNVRMCSEIKIFNP